MKDPLGAASVLARSHIGTCDQSYVLVVGQKELKVAILHHTSNSPMSAEFTPSARVGQTHTGCEVFGHLEGFNVADVNQLPPSALKGLQLLVLALFYDRLIGEDSCNVLLPCNSKVKELLLSNPVDVTYHDILPDLFSLMRTMGVSLPSVVPRLSNAVVKRCLDACLQQSCNV